MKLARRVLELEESATLAVSNKAAKMQAEGVNVISFGAGELDFPTPVHIQQAAMDAIRAGHTGYCKPTHGIPAAKKAVCAKFARYNALSYSPEQVIIDAGGKMSVYLAVHALVDKGDEVIIPVPYWVSYPEIVKLAGGTPVFVAGSESRDYKLSPEDLAKALTPRTRMVIMCSPSNPSGVTYHPDEIRALAKVLEDRDLIVLSDEIYDELLYHGQQTLSFAAASAKAYAQTVTLNSLSKTYAMTGWRIGYAAGPVELIKAMAKLQSQTTSGAVTFNQHALVTALTGDQGCVRAFREELERRAKLMHSRLAAIPGVRCPKPTGAFYCFPNVGATFAKLSVKNSTQWAERLLEEAKVAVVPGGAFGLDDHVRLSFSTHVPNIEEGLRRIESFVK
jgi:aspartate aminotransferase